MKHAAIHDIIQNHTVARNLENNLTTRREQHGLPMIAVIAVTRIGYAAANADDLKPETYYRTYKSRINSCFMFRTGR